MCIRDSFKILGAKIVDRLGKNAADTAVGHFHHSAPLRGDADADDTPVIRVGHAPVSYTHLDVYKRQGQERIDAFLDEWDEVKRIYAFIKGEEV